MNARCWVGASLHGPGTDCPSLTFHSGRYWCGAIEKAGADQPLLKKELYVGEGCCMPLFNDMRKERFSRMTPTQKKEYDVALSSLRRSSSTSFR